MLTKLSPTAVLIQCALQCTLLTGRGSPSRIFTASTTPIAGSRLCFLLLKTKRPSHARSLTMLLGKLEHVYIYTYTWFLSIMSDLSAEAVISLIGVLLSVPTVVVLLWSLSHKRLRRHSLGMSRVYSSSFFFYVLLQFSTLGNS